MRFTIGLSLFLLCVSLIHSANLRWPVASKIKSQISSTFGESRNDHYHNGLDLPGENLSVYALSKGQLLWSRQTIKLKGRIPFGGGKTVVIRHNDTMQSGYMHLNSISDKLMNEKYTDAQESLGLSGNTGHSGGAHIHFFLYNHIKREFLNPLNFLSNDYYQDTKPPEALGYGVLINNEMHRITIDKPFILSTEHPIYVRLYDRGIKNERWGVYKLDAYNTKNSNASFSLKFDKINWHKNRWVTNYNLSFDEVYFENWIKLGTGFKRSSFIKWRASGLKGPEGGQEYNLTIRDR